MPSPRASACALPLRRRGEETEVLLLRRSPDLAFLGGFDVFPGGTVDAVDGPASADRRSTAARELFEESGILALPGAEAVPKVRRDQVRRSLLANDPQPWLELLAQHPLDVGAWTEFGSWLTPPYTPQLFHAIYYTVWVEEDFEVWPGGLTQGGWHTARSAIAAHNAGDLFISYPVLETLKLMVRHGGDLAAAAAEAQARGDSHPRGGGEMIAGVHVVPLRTYTLPPATHTNCYVLGHKDLVVVDPATPIEAERQRLLDYLQFLQQSGACVREIWLSHHHQDHIGAVDWLRQQLTVPVAAHALTAADLAGEIDIDRTIADGDITELSLDGGHRARWQALHTPGHDRGHLCFFEQERGTLLSGDNVVGLGTVIIKSPDGNMVQYFDSLRRMLALPTGFMFPSHGPPCATPKKRIQFYIDHRTARETAIANSLRDGPLRPRAIVERVYTELAAGLYPLAEINVRAHLDKLVVEGRVAAAGDEFVLSESPDF